MRLPAATLAPVLALALLATATGCSAREPGSSPTTSAAATSTRSPAAAKPADETARLQPRSCNGCSSDRGTTSRRWRRT